MKKIIPLALLVMLLFGAHAAVSVRMHEGAALLDDFGSEIIAVGEYSDIVPLGEGLFAVTADEKTYALMNDEGNVLGEAIYEELRLRGNAILGRVNGLWGVVRPDGVPAGDFAYTSLVSDGRNFWALKGSLSDQDSDELFILDADGNERETGLFVRRMAETASDGRIAVQMQGGLAWGYCDAGGSLVIPAEYSYAGAFTGGRAIAARDGKYGAIDADGGVLLPARYDFMEISPSGLMLAASAETGIHVFNSRGEEIAAYAGEEMFAALVGEGYAVYGPERTALYDAGGMEIASASRRASFLEGLNGQVILAEGSWGEECVSILGTEAKYQNLYPLGMAGDTALYAYMQVNAARYMNDLLDEIQLAMDMENARYGVADEAGKVLMPAQYQEIHYLGDDRLLACIDGQWQMMDSRGSVMWSYGIRQDTEPSF